MLALMESQKWRDMTPWLSTRAGFDEVLISATEERGVKGRIQGFMHKVGVVRDMLQSHMLQMMAIAMLPDPEASTPDDWDLAYGDKGDWLSDAATSKASAKPVDQAKLDILTKAVNNPSHIVLGQYENYVDDWMTEGVSAKNILQAIKEKGDTTYARMQFFIGGGAGVSRFAGDALNPGMGRNRVKGDGSGITLESGKALANKRKYIKYTADGPERGDGLTGLSCEFVINIAGAQRAADGTKASTDRWISMTEEDLGEVDGVAENGACDEFEKGFEALCYEFGALASNSQGEFSGVSQVNGTRNWFDRGRAGPWCAIGIPTGFHESAYGNIFAGMFRGERNLFLNLEMHLAQWRLLGDSLDPPAEKVHVYPQCEPSSVFNAEICPTFLPGTLEEHTRRIATTRWPPEAEPPLA